MKTDVIINVYGKPFQTLCTLKSLLLHSGNHIDKIYATVERQHPYNDNSEWALDLLVGIVIYNPDSYVFMPYEGSHANSLNIRYQYGIENSNKKHVFITHNDVLYESDIIGVMLSQIENNAGIGQIGMCWNCPANYEGLCCPDKAATYKHTYKEALELLIKHPNTRTKIIDKENPMPLPECRLNEWACLIDREVTVKENNASNATPYFGLSENVDTACSWYRSLFLKGYTFKNMDINKYINHGFWAGTAGYPTELNEVKYKEAEKKAELYFNENFK